MPVVLMYSPSALPRSATLVSPATICTPASCAAACIDGSHAFQRLHRQAFFQDKAGRQEQRLRARHGHIVDRAAHRQLADIAAGEEQRGDDVRVGGDGQRALQPGFGQQVQPGKVVASASARAVQVRAENALDQVLRHSPAAAMAHHDLFAVRQRQRANRAFKGWSIFRCINAFLIMRVRLSSTVAVIRRAGAFG